MLENINVRERLAPLIAQYKEAPETAKGTNYAKTIGDDLANPYHGKVVPGEKHNLQLRIGAHKGVGGFHDAPCPGDILCAALAACQESAIRMTANILGITLTSLEVEVTAGIDIRGALGIEREVPVGYQSMKCQVKLQTAEGSDPKLVKKLVKAAVHSCPVSQTLRSGVPVETEFNLD
jgi:uncharacterized OsmC-like protein